MLEVALLAVASVVALALAGWVARVAPGEGVAPAPIDRIRDDAIVAAIASVSLFLAMALAHRRAGALTFAAWSAGACAFGALASIGARAWRDRTKAARHAGAIGERAIVVLALGLLTIASASAAHALGDPQHLATQVPEMVVAFAVGCAVIGEGSVALPTVAAMVLASYFFDVNAGMLRSGASHASALGLVVFPVTATALGALGASVALMVRPDFLLSARRDAVAMLAIPSIVAVGTAAIALLGWLWQPFALCGAVGGVMTLVPRLVRREGARREMAALVALGAAATGSFAIARHAGLAHAGFFGVAVAAIAAESATAWVPASIPPVPDEDALAQRQAAALSAVAIAMAVLDGAALFRCTRFADAAHAPTADVATMLAHCTFGGVTPARIDVSHPMTLSCAVLAVAVCAAQHDTGPEGALRGRVVTVALAVGAVAVVALLGHFFFGVGLECIAAAALASSLVAALFPAACSRDVARIVAASALALGAVVG